MGLTGWRLVKANVRAKRREAELHLTNDEKELRERRLAFIVDAIIIATVLACGAIYFGGL